MKNNKGFTLVEMLVSFSLSMILIIILFQLIINLKDVYMTSGIKTELLNKQYLMTTKIYDDRVEVLNGCEKQIVYKDENTKLYRKLVIKKHLTTLVAFLMVIFLNHETIFLFV